MPSTKMTCVLTFLNAEGSLSKFGMARACFCKITIFIKFVEQKSFLGPENMKTGKFIVSICAAALLAAACGETTQLQPFVTASPEDFGKYFTGERMRVDVVFSGNAESQSVSLDAVYREGPWSGSPKSIIDPFGYGDYLMEVFSGSTLIYSKGFNTLFEEWRTTEQAAEQTMSAGQALWLPFPRQEVELKLWERIRTTGEKRPLFSCKIDPNDRHIVSGPQNAYNVTPYQENGPVTEKVDIAIVAEGYSEASMAKFREDAARLAEYFFTIEPYASRRDDFNVWLVESVSEDDGVDIPQDGIWRRTAMDSMFDTFYTDRYLAIMDHRKIASAVSGAPFDAIMIIANESKYGGGGFYNSYAIGTADNPRSFPVYIHEFGHSFAGLGDEYYDSDVAYEDFYPAGVEPWEPNITTMVDFESKWMDMIEDGTPVPTPADDEYADAVGVFEGAGYMAKGCYRPFVDCRMKTTGISTPFCPVCVRAIGEMIDYYTAK